MKKSLMENFIFCALVVVEISEGKLGSSPNFVSIIKQFQANKLLFHMISGVAVEVNWGVGVVKVN